MFSLSLNHQSFLLSVSQSKTILWLQLPGKRCLAKWLNSNKNLYFANFIARQRKTIVDKFKTRQFIFFVVQKRWKKRIVIEWMNWSFANDSLFAKKERRLTKMRIKFKVFYSIYELMINIVARYNLRSSF